MTKKTVVIRRARIAKINGTWTISYFHEGLPVGIIGWGGYAQALHQALVWTRQAT